MKKICYFINSDWYFDLHWLERACAAQKDGYEVHVMTRFNGDEFISKFKRLGFICHPVRLRERSLNPFGFLYAMLDVALTLAQMNPSIIHSITIKPIIMGGIVSRLAQKPFVANIVGLGRVFDCNGMLYRSIRKCVILLYKFIFNNKKSRIIFEHQQDRDILNKYISLEEGKTEIIDGAGVDTSLFPYQEEKEFLRPIVFFAGRMLKNKGLKTLVEIKRELKEKNIYFDLVVAGIEVPDDPQAIPSSQLTAWHEQGDIIWLGTRRDVAQLITKSSIIALPTLYPEGVPRILIEACAIGRPCIAYNSGGCNSIINDGETGFLISRNDQEEFRDKLLLLISQPNLRKRMGINGRNLVMKKFSSEKVVAKTLMAYNDII